MQHPTRTRLARRSALGLLVLGGLTGGLAHAQTAVPAQPTASAPLVLRGATVIDVRSGRQLPGQQVVIVGNRVQTVTAAGRAPLPKGARVIDARGKYLIPGLWDMHVHTYPEGLPSYPRLLANGVTGFRDAGANRGELVLSLDTLRRWRREILAGTRIGPPRQVLSGQKIDQWTFGPATGGPSEANLRQLVDSLVAAGADMIKAHEVDKATFAIIAAEARRLGVPFGGHAPAMQESDTAAVTPLGASALGARIIDHEMGGASCWRMGLGIQPVAGTDFDACQRSIRQFRQNDTWFVPTAVIAITPHSIGLIDSVEWRILNDFESAVQRFHAGAPLQGRSLRKALAPIALTRHSDAHLTDSSRVFDLVRRELPILAGTDCCMRFYGFFLHLELATLVGGGWTPLDALRAATLNPAKALHATDSLGTVEAGKLADIVVLDADPLEDITNTAMIRAVVADGRYFDRAALDDLLDQSRVRPGASTP